MREKATLKIVKKHKNTLIISIVAFICIMGINIYPVKEWMVISLIVLNSSVVQFEYKELVLNTVLVGVLIYSVNILWDTGKAVFVIIG